jgi:hypothetical protein
MKKILAILALAAITGTSFAADFVSVAVEHVTDRASSAKSTVEYVRAGKEINGLQYGLQSRSARSNDGTGLYSSLEGTVGKNYGVAGFNVTPFVGAGRDLTKNGASEPYTYGLVGVTAGKQVGPGFLLGGVKTRAGSTEASTRTKQTVSFAEYAYPVAKNLAVTAGVSRSTQDIRERAVSVGVTVGF